MKKKLLKIADELIALGVNDEYVHTAGKSLKIYAEKLPEDSVSSSETSNDEEDPQDDNGNGGNHPPGGPGKP